MNIIDKKKIVRASITQAGVPVLFDNVVEASEIYTDPVQLTITENKTVVIKAEDIDREQREAQGLTPYDGMAQVEVTVDVPSSGGGDDPDPLHYHIGDIVLYDAANDKKVKTTKDAFNLEKYPADNFTPIGVIFHVNEDGSGRMISLAGMSAETPDTGSDVPESLPWGGYGVDIPELENYSRLAVIDDSGIVTGDSSTAYVPALSYIMDVPALDGKRYYSSLLTPYMPSPYNADGSMNSEFFKRRVDDTIFYEWRRFTGSYVPYYIYTDKPGDQLDENTKLYGFSQGHNSFVPNYGFPQSGTIMTYLGLITDTAIYDGGVENFATDFTSTGKSFPRPLLANSDMDGAGNTSKILSHQNEIVGYDYVTGGDTTYNNVNMYFWTRHNNSDNRDYWFYTTDEVPTNDTEIWIVGYNSSSFLKDYGTINSDNYSSWVKVGAVGDGTHITGGATSFTDGTFTRKSEGIIYYYWQRYNESDGNMYFLYTNDDPEHITNDTIIYILGYSVDSFVYDYGISSVQSYKIKYIGTIGDPTYISGGTEGFLSNFTHLYPVPWKTNSTIVKAASANNYPAACSTWRYHTPGTKQGDWYLPSAGENLIVSANLDYIVESLRLVKMLCPNIKVSGLNNSRYFSSTENQPEYTVCVFYYNGNVYFTNSKNEGHYIYVRAVTQVPSPILQLLA